MTIQLSNILAEFKQALDQRYGDKIAALVCYGSQARGEAGPDSDIDLVLVLKGEIRPPQIIDQVVDVLADFNLKYGVLISLIPVSQESWEKADGPFWRNVRREGVPV
jgi:predicted nucleotidyltransferase